MLLKQQRITYPSYPDIADNLYSHHDNLSMLSKHHGLCIHLIQTQRITYPCESSSKVVYKCYPGYPNHINVLSTFSEYYPDYPNGIQKLFT